MAVSISSTVWYALYYGSPDNQNALMAVSTTGTSGIVATNLTTVKSPLVGAFQWQILALESSNTYAFRNLMLGNQYYLGTFVYNTTTSETRINSESFGSTGVIASDAQWTIQPTTDGTGMYYMSTVVNGTNWRLDGGGLDRGTCRLKSAIDGAGTNAMKWSFSSISAINNAQWSYGTINAASATSASSSTQATSTSSPASNSAASTTATSTSASQSSEGSDSNKTPTGAIVGGVIGGVIVILMIIGLIVFYRLKKKKIAALSAHQSWNNSPETIEAQSHYTYSPRFGTPIKTHPGTHEVASTPLFAKDHPPGLWSDPTELPLNTRHPR